jgi:hypothetical protein
LGSGLKEGDGRLVLPKRSVQIRVRCPNFVGNSVARDISLCFRHQDVCLSFCQPAFASASIKYDPSEVEY